MTVAEIIKNAKKTAFSFEVLPPLKGTGTDALFLRTGVSLYTRNRQTEHI